MPNAIEISQLSHAYGKVQALRDVSLAIGRGATVGLIGPDGVGKSTLLSLIAGVRTLQSGEVRVLGHNVAHKAERESLLPRIAFMPQGLGKNLYPTLSVYENIDFHARLFGLNKHQRKQHIDRLMFSTGLAPFADRAAGKLSGGMKQKLGLCCALVHDPELLILDEPFSGLDPVAVDVMSQVLLERAAAGVPTLFSSHQLDVVERLCDRVVIIRSGRLVADGTIPELQATEAPRWRVVVEQAAGSAPVEAASLNLPAPAVELDDAGRLVITAAGADEQALLSTAQRLGTVRELGPVRHRLTEIFREVLTTSSHEGTADANETKEAR